MVLNSDFARCYSIQLFMKTCIIFELIKKYKNFENIQNPYTFFTFDLIIVIYIYILEKCSTLKCTEKLAKCQFRKLISHERKEITGKSAIHIRFGNGGLNTLSATVTDIVALKNLQCFK